MKSRARWLLVAAVLTALMEDAAAAPPASCARKFIGTWVYAGGTTVVAPGGIAYPKCPMCVPTQTWTCQGNTYLFSNSGPPGQFSATLSADGRQLIGSGVVATRVGGAARGGAADVKSCNVGTKVEGTTKIRSMGAHSERKFMGFSVERFGSCEVSYVIIPSGIINKVMDCMAGKTLTVSGVIKNEPAYHLHASSARCS